MKLSELIANVSDKNFNPYPDFSVFNEETSVYRCNERIKAYWISQSLDSDTVVGMQAFFIDGKFVALTVSTSRKSDTDVFYPSTEAYHQIQALLSNADYIDLIDLDKEYGDYYSVAWGPSVVVKNGVYNGKPCKIVERVSRYNPNTMDFNQTEVVTVEFEDGERKVIDISDFKIPWNS